MKKRAMTLALTACLWAPAALGQEVLPGATPGLAGIRTSAAAFDAARLGRREAAAQWWRRHTEGAPYTGRHRPMLLPERTEEAVGRLLYRRFLSGSAPSHDPEKLAKLRRVSARLIAAADREDWVWEVALLDAGPTGAFGVAGDQDQAFALTGGKVGVLSGMVDAAEGDAELAALLAHELGHALARHLGERISELLLLEAGLTAAGTVVPPALAVVIPAVVPAAVDAARLVSLAQGLYGFGTPRGKRALLSRFSRTQEEEADYIGLVLMAKAGYDPGGAAAYWGRLLPAASPARPGWEAWAARHLALHTNTAERIAKMEAEAPTVRAAYAASGAAQER